MKISRSTIIALGVTAGVVLWMLTGLAGGGDTATPQSPASVDRDAVMTVAVRESRARPVTREVLVSGRTEPNRIVEIAAETEGRVVAITTDRGEPVTAGQEIIQLDMRDRESREAEAQALVRQREMQFEAAQRLGSRDFLSETQIAETSAQLESARAALAAIRQEIRWTTIEAPFAGMLEERGVELGDFVGVGDTVARLVDIDPLIVVSDVSEREIQYVRTGGVGRVSILGGDIVEGTVRYVSPVANASTRTFRVELAVANPDSSLRAGTSAQMVLPAETTDAHFLSPALLVLNDQGQIGVKSVGPGNRVEFHAIEIVESASTGIWVSGLPPLTSVITVGQGFVAVGETVNPVPVSESMPATEALVP